MQYANSLRQVKQLRESKIWYICSPVGVTIWVLKVTRLVFPGKPLYRLYTPRSGLRLQLVTTLADQIDGEIELKGNSETEFTIRFTVIEIDGQAMTTPP